VTASGEKGAPQFVRPIYGEGASEIASGTEEIAREPLAVLFQVFRHFGRSSHPGTHLFVAQATIPENRQPIVLAFVDEESTLHRIYYPASAEIGERLLQTLERTMRSNIDNHIDLACALACSKDAGVSNKVFGIHLDDDRM